MADQNPSPKKKRSHRFRKRIKRRTPPGAAPGTLVSDPEAMRPVVRVFGYQSDGYVEEEVQDLSEIPKYLEKWRVTWVNVDGLGDPKVIAEIGKIFGIHRLALEDVINVHQRPKVDHYDGYYYLVTRLTTLNVRCETEQLSIFVGRDFVVTFQEAPGDCFDPVRTRIRKGGGKIRDSHADYLAYALLDASIDSFFPVLEEYGDRIETLEYQIISSPEPSTVPVIHEIKRDLAILRRIIWPLREAVNVFLRDDAGILGTETRLHLRDCYDHCIQILDVVEIYRELSADLMDVYLSSTSNKMNEVMKVLTIISTIFIPLTFIVGVYGMNFDVNRSPWNMPELEWYWGYPFIWLMMITIAGLMIYFFYRKGWLSSLDLLRYEREKENLQKRERY